jgi:hypothetical protein
MFVLGMALVDLFIGGFVLPMRFIGAYGNPLTLNLCSALAIGESCAMAAVIYGILSMIYTRLYDITQVNSNIRRRSLIILLLSTWTVLLLFYGIPFLVNYSSYGIATTSTISNITTYCSTYITSVYRPSWMAYTEIGMIYSCPVLLIVIGLIGLSRHLCQARPKRMEVIQRRMYREQRQMTWHVLLLGVTFLLLCLPWISVRILTIFWTTQTMQRALQITYYILIIKSAVFPILYASTNTAFRGSFAIYRHKRITINSRTWAVNVNSSSSIHHRHGY